MPETSAAAGSEAVLACSRAAPPEGGALPELPAAAAQADPEAAAAVLAREGALVVRGAVPGAALLQAARQHVEGALAAALAGAGEGSTAGGEGLGAAASPEQLDAESRWFGNVQVGRALS